MLSTTNKYPQNATWGWRFSLEWTRSELSISFQLWTQSGGWGTDDLSAKLQLNFVREGSHWFISEFAMELSHMYSYVHKTFVESLSHHSACSYIGSVRDRDIAMSWRCMHHLSKRHRHSYQTEHQIVFTSDKFPLPVFRSRPNLLERQIQIVIGYRLPGTEEIANAGSAFCH